MTGIDTTKEPHQPDRERGHAFDGITEFDNDLPRWWLAMLYISIAFAFWYVIHYTFSSGVVGPERWNIEMNAMAEERARHQSGPVSETMLRQLSTNPQRIERGKTLFGSVGCMVCHGPDATGLIGPNLRDRYWIYGSKMTNIVDDITNGRANNAMPAQKAALSSDDINDLAIYIVSLNRSGLKPGKAPDLSRELDNPITY